MFNKLFKKSKPQSEELPFYFSDEKNTACFTCRHVLEDKSPILYVSHDEDDGSWQFLCGGNGHEGSDAKIVGLFEIVKIDPSINELYEMPLGVCAEREFLGAEWKPYKK